MTVIAQDDHLTAGAWAACDVTLKEIRRKLNTVNKNTPCSTLQISFTFANSLQNIGYFIA